MPNGLPNILTAPLTAIKQVGEQTTATISSMGQGLSQAASQGLDALISGVPSLPGANAARPAGLPNLRQLMPANLQAALRNVQNIILPPGLARTPSPTPQPQTEPSPAATPQPASNQPISVTRQIVERRGL